MTSQDYLQFLLFLAVLIGFTPILGRYMAGVFDGTSKFVQRASSIEKFFYKLFGVDAQQEMGWKTYGLSLLAFNLMGLIFLMIVLMTQGSLPLNPQNVPSMSWHLALNTAVSFVTNTNWQSYAGEVAVSNLSQMMALAVQNFVSAAVGIAVAIALARGIARRSSQSIGNFWVDLTRSILYILLPLSVILTVLLIAEGTVQTFSSAIEVTTLEGLKQVIALGPAASQIAIKMLGTNGGGFFNANSAHPFENPTAVTNFLQMWAIFIIPAALTFTFGSIIKSRRHGWVIFGVMMTLFVALTSASLVSEYSTNPIYQQGALMEGKEARFGVFNSILFSSITTSASCGAVNSMHSSLSPLSGGIALLNMMLGEVVFGGVGAGLYGMLLFVLLTVFIAGLMVGRTPEYLGKKIESKEMAWIIFAILAPCCMILLGTAMSVALPVGLSSLLNKGPHGFTEILYAFTSAAANNGSAFAGLNGNTAYYNVMLSIAMLVGRFAIIFPVLAVAGNLAQKKYAAPSLGTFQVDTLLFGFLLIAVILIVGALTFLPSLSLGPIVEHLLMLKGRTF